MCTYHPQTTSRQQSNFVQACRNTRNERSQGRMRPTPAKRASQDRQEITVLICGCRSQRPFLGLGLHRFQPAEIVTAHIHPYVQIHVRIRSWVPAHVLRVVDCCGFGIHAHTDDRVELDSVGQGHTIARVCRSNKGSYCSVGRWKAS